MQRIKEFSWGFLYNTVLTDVIKNSIASYMMELLQKCLKQPETNADLFNFCEAALLQLDVSSKKVAANFPLFFALHLTHFFGFRMEDNHTAENTFIDLREGIFTNHQPVHPHFIDGEKAVLISQLLKVMQPYELEEFNLNHIIRRQLLLHLQDYYALHIPEFGQMKTLMVLHEVL